MISVFQFPLTDLRFFLPEKEKNVLKSPNWHAPNDNEFIKAVGGIRKRKGIDLANELIGENYYCRGRNLLKILPTTIVNGRQDQEMNEVCIYRNLFNNGFYTLRYEMAFRYDANLWNIAWDNYSYGRTQPIVYEFDQMTDRLCERLKSNVYVRLKKDSHTSQKVFTSLVHSGKNIAAAFEQNTSIDQTLFNYQNSYVKAGQPLAWVITPGPIKNAPAPIFTKQTLIGDVKVNFSFYFLLINGYKIHYWLISPCNGYRFKKSSFVASRSLRISLMRIHAERECMKMIIRNIDDFDLTKYSHAAEKFQLYLRDFHKVLRKQKDPLLKMALTADSLATSNELNNYFEKIKIIHPQLHQVHIDKIKYIWNQLNITMEDNRVTFNGPANNIQLVTGDNNTVSGSFSISDSYNAISEMSPEMKVLFEEMLPKLQDAAKNLSVEDQKELATETNNMSKAAAEGKSGLQKFLTASGKVLELVKNVSGVASIIGATIAKIVGIF